MSDIQEQIKLAHKRAEENDIKLLKEEIKEILQKFNEKVKNVELIRNPYSSEDKKFKKILIYLEEDHCDIFKNILDYITNLQEENEYFNHCDEEKRKKITNLEYRINDLYNHILKGSDNNE